MNHRLLLLFLFIGNAGYSQNAADLQFATTLNAGKKTFNSTIFPRTTEKKDISRIMYQPYLFYKNIFSSQDGISCSFYPSCSTYGYQSIVEYGLLKGGLEGFDRISRCHNLDHKHYLKHKSGFWHDSVFPKYDE